ncbi:MAG: peptidoglycan-binding protein [Kovacikia sp.]
MDCRMEDLVERLMEASQKYESKLDKYLKLASRNELTEEEADQITAIYIEAEQDRLLNFFINEWDYLLGQKLGLLNANSIKKYKDQQSWLREHLQEMLLDQEYRKEVQCLLRSQNVYDGPIDGVLGKRSQAAVKQFQQSHRLKDDGVPGQQTFTALQRSSALQFINELDYPLAQKLGLLEPTVMEDCKNQQSRVREHLQKMLVDQEYRRKAQRLLREQNFYDGPIDGVLGKQSQAAVKQFQRSQQLKDNGVPGQQNIRFLSIGVDL